MPKLAAQSQTIRRAELRNTRMKKNCARNWGFNACLQMEAGQKERFDLVRLTNVT